MQSRHAMHRRFTLGQEHQTTFLTTYGAANMKISQALSEELACLVNEPLVLAQKNQMQTVQRSTRQDGLPTF